MSPFPRIGLVLSGGGSRGVAHVGVLRALAERGIEPDEVAGVSSGAIVGALYAAGYPPAEMLEFFAKRNPFRISNLSWAKPGFLDTSKVVPDFEEYFPNDSFEALGKRLRIIATDLLSGEPVVFDSGPLILPVIASSSVPMLFTPTEINGRCFADGGISDNFPARLLSDECEVILGVHVGQLRQLEMSDLHSSLNVLQRAMEVGMYLSSRAKYDQCDLVISPTALRGFTAFDTKQFEQIEAVGYEAALKRMDEIVRLVQAKRA